MTFSVGALWLALAATAAAQDLPPSLLPPDTVLPPVTVPPPPSSRGANSAPASPNACAGTENGAPPPLDCVNQKLKQQVDQINPSLTAPSAPLDVRSPDTRIDIVNVPAVQQQYGQNFGVSAIPTGPRR